MTYPSHYAWRRIASLTLVVASLCLILPLTVRSAAGASSAASSAADEWTQDAHDAQRTGATSEEPAEPWTLLWTWNGPDANGGTGSHFYDAPKEARTVTGGSNVYVPAGSRGLYALSKANGSITWNVSATSFNAAAAYDAAYGAVFAGGANGLVYKIDAGTGQVTKTYSAGSPINKAVLLNGGYVYVVTDSGQLHKIDESAMTAAWVYSAGARGSTPPSYSASRDAIVFATGDLYVHAVNNGNGTMKWRTKPTPNPAIFPYQFDDGWPVVADRHGIVFLRMLLGPSSLTAYPGTSNIFPSSNSATRSFLDANPLQQNLFALSLDTGAKAFTPAVGFGSTEGWVNGAVYPSMGTQPIVKVWPNGDEVAYILFRNGQSNPPDYRWDGHMGEMALDGSTVPGLVAGDLRFVRMSRLNGQGNAYVYLSDEQNPITIAGNTLFHAHWGASESVTIGDRSDGLGLAYSSPIATTNHPTVIRRQQSCGSFNPTTHYTTCGLTLFADGRYWNGPGFWTYWNVVDPPGSPVSSSYSAGFLPRYTYVSSGLMVVEGNGGDLMVFAYGGGSPAATPTATSRATSSPTATPRAANSATATARAAATATPTPWTWRHRSFMPRVAVR